MTYSSAYPSDKKLSLHNVSTWDYHGHKVISAYSDMGTAIRKNIPFVLHHPTTADLFPGTDLSMYHYVPVVPHDATSHAAFASAMTQYLKMDKARRDEEAKLCAFLKSSFSDER